MKFFVGFIGEYGNPVQFSKLFNTKQEAEACKTDLEENSNLDLLEFAIFCK